ncbi:uncharacterized protein J4E78_000434 [Alternaria triticimaculans]|uniref:uncharacterized protein n=1 Tax=Alternaria triticimaculans TaxID=297637 RepID=UPI0020C1F742|nr:uncharacterized protein J4E78_000434 [Alternaria triticimaculans]KAI4671936.1 hypothetical protein J4E78_000434 [Alternaria triticimaculans]
MPSNLILDLLPEDFDHLHISPDRWQDQETTITLITKQIQREENHPFDPHRPPLHVSLSINNPQTLAELGEQLSNLPPRTRTLSLTLPENPPGAKLSRSDVSLPVKYITGIRVKILADGFPEYEPTPEDWNELAQAWGDAFFCMPGRHHIENVLLDLRGIDPFVIPDIVPLLVEVTTELYTRTKEDSGRELVFGVVGAERQRQWIEGQLPGKSEDDLFDEELAAARRQRGRT